MIAGRMEGIHMASPDPISDPCLTPSRPLPERLTSLEASIAPMGFLTDKISRISEIRERNDI